MIHVAEFHFSWKPCAEALNIKIFKRVKYQKIFFFDFGAPFWVITSSIKILAWKVHVDIISLSKIMSISVLRSFVWKLLGIWGVGLRGFKYISTMINGSYMKFFKNFSNRNKMFPSHKQKWTPEQASYS